MRNKFFIVIIIFGVTSCTKARKYSGDYFCEVKGHYYELYTYSTDTIYTEILEVKREKKSIRVMDRLIYTDSLTDEEWYEYSGYPSIFNIKIIKDSMYIYTWSGGQGGGASRAYACKKD